ncbi:hypothetical protein TNCT_505251, partial [Trichonephila clavata]
ALPTETTIVIKIVSDGTVGTEAEW